MSGELDGDDRTGWQRVAAAHDRALRASTPVLVNGSTHRPVDVSSGGGPLDAAPDGPVRVSGFVLRPMMAKTEAMEVIHECRATLVPRQSMIHLAVAGWHAAAWCLTQPVAGPDEGDLRRRRAVVGLPV
jgi:hypothetical protein